MQEMYDNLPPRAAWPTGAGEDPCAVWEPLALGDGRETPVLRLRPRNASGRLPVLYLHGIQSHPLWFLRSAVELARDGRELWLPVRRGSGPWREDRGHADSGRQLLEDVDRAVAALLSATGKDRAHLLGVSWGGKLLAAWATMRRPGVAASMTLIAPGILPRRDLSLPAKIGVGLGALLGRRWRFELPLGDASLFTAEADAQAWIREDPLSLREATAQFYLASKWLDWQLRTKPRGAIRLPATLILAGRDRIIRNGPTAKVLGYLTDGRCRTVELAGAHTLEFEPRIAPLLETVREGMDAAEAGQSFGDEADCESPA